MNKSNDSVTAFFNIAAVILCLVLFVIPFAAGEGIIDRKEYTMYPFGDGWLDEDGNEADFSLIKSPETHPAIFTKKAAKFELSEKSLCFRSKNVNFKVYRGGRLIYEFYPEASEIFGESYGQYIHCIYIPRFEGNTEIRIEAESVYNDSSSYFHNMCTGDSGEYMRRLFRDNLLKLVISFIMFVIGSILIMLSLALRKYLGESIYSLISLGAFAMVAGLWTSTESIMLQMITQAPFAVHFLNYVSLMMVPVPSVTFVASITDNRKSPLVPAVIGCSLMNLAMSVILTVRGVSDYHKLLTVTHAVLVLAIVSIFGIIIKGYKNRHRGKKVYFVLGGAFMLIVVMGIIDLVRYRVVLENTDSGFFIRLGMLLFIIVMGVYTLIDLINLTRMGRKAEFMRELAYNDVLTGLLNRFAFAESEKLVAESAEAGQVCFAQFDINNLKIANDVYGHSEGDRQIIAGANAIKESFGELGKCFRTGGDEFIAIINCPINSPKIIEAERRIAELTDKYNEENSPPVKLQIAYGIAPYDGKDPAAAEREADEKMYIMKKRMKSGVVPPQSSLNNN